MKKLNLDDLNVESFETRVEATWVRGTVRGNATYPYAGWTCEYGCQQNTGRTDPCDYPSTSCQSDQTFGEATCWCEYPATDVRVCCSNEGCSGGGMC